MGGHLDSARIMCGWYVAEMMHGQLGEYKMLIALELEARSGKERLKMVTEWERRVHGCQRG